MEPRIGDVERDVAASRLGDHFAAGRLDHEEYDERLDAIWSARTSADLDQLFWDLPVVATPRPVSPPAPVVSRGRAARFPVWMLVLGVLMIIAVANAPWWAWLIALVVLLKRPWRHRHPATWRHGQHHGGPHFRR